MRLLYPFLSVLWLCTPTIALGYDLLIAQSSQRGVYEQTAQQIRKGCGASSETMLLSNYAEFDLARIVREERPRMVVAIGEQALREARKLRRTDVVYALVLNVNENALGDNIDGVSMHVAPDNYLKLFKQLQLKRVGTIYNKRNSGAWLERASKAAAGSGIVLVPQEVASSHDVPTALNQLQKDAVDAIWMIPDSTAVNEYTVDTYFLFAQKHNLPVISFAKGYLAKGALAVLEANFDAVAAQSCDLIRQSGKDSPKTSTIVDINDATLHINENVAARLHLQITGLEKLFPRHP